MIGDHAMLTFRKHFNSTFTYLNRIIGMKNDTDYFKREIEMNQADIQYQVDENDEILYKINLKEKETMIPSESLLAAFIYKIKNDLIINLHKKEYFAFTIGVHDYMTVGHREAMGRAMKTCELDNYNIINESTAITLYYGYNKYKNLFVESDMSDSKQIAINPNLVRYVIFIDFGHSKTSFILSEFHPTFFKVLKVQNDPFMGGRDLDRIIFEHLSGVFYKQTKVDLKENKKSQLKLFEQITKARKILTGNQETQINIDCLYEDYDFSYLLKRTEFETLIKSLTDKFQQSLQNFYKTSIDFIDKPLFAIEMAGECMRTPILQSIVKEATGKELQKSIIVDEVVSKGCAMYTALVYNSLPIQSFNGIYNLNPYTITYNLNNETNATILINCGEFIPQNKIINVPLTKKSGNIQKIQFNYIRDETEFILGNYSTIAEYHINLQELTKVNKLNTASLYQTGLNLEFLIDNSGKIHLQNINKNLHLDINILCLNPKHPDTIINHKTLIKNQFDEMNLIENLKKIEKEHLQQDNYIIELHIQKNKLESNVYKLKSKYLEKDLEYEKLHEKTGHNRTVLQRLDSIEQALQGSSDNMDQKELGNVDSKIQDIEKFLSRKKTDEMRAPIKTSLSHQQFNDKLNYYSDLVDKEYIKILEGKHAKFDEKTIHLISEILSKFRILMNSSEEKDVRVHMMNFEKEMKKYFK